MKYKIVSMAILFVLAFGAIAFADYIEPTSTAPSSNTGSVVKIGPKNTTTTTYEKLGIGDGTLDSVNELKNKASTYLASGSYAGSGNGTKGFLSDRLVVTGATNVITGKDFIVSVIDVEGGYTFDQFKDNNSVEYFKFITDTNKPRTTPKPLEAFVAGRYISNFAITKDDEITGTQNPNLYSLELRAASGFSPTTNIGLGNRCDLYPADLGTSVGDGGGCPAGSYMSRYVGPSFSGTPNATNNTNTQVVATCTEFNPALSPTSGSHCATGRSFTNAIRIGKYVSSGNVCTFTLSSGSSFTNPDVPANFNGKNVKIRWYSLGGNPARSYVNTLDDQKTFTYGCAQDSWEAEVYDDYGQYFNITR